MFEKSHVFDGNHGTPELLRNLLQRRQNPAFDKKLSDELLVARIHLCDKTRLVVLQLIQVGEITRVVPQQHDCAQHPNENHGPHRNQRDLPPAPWTARRWLARRLRKLNWSIDRCHGKTVWKDSGSPYRGGTQNSSKYRVDVQLVGHPTLEYTRPSTPDSRGVFFFAFGC